MPSRTFRPPKGPCQLHLRTLVINIFPFQKLQKTERHCLVALDSKHYLKKKKFNDLKQGMHSSIPQRFHHFQRSTSIIIHFKIPAWHLWTFVLLRFTCTLGHRKEVRWQSRSTVGSPPLTSAATTTLWMASTWVHILFYFPKLHFSKNLI